MTIARRLADAPWRRERTPQPGPLVWLARDVKHCNERMKRPWAFFSVFECWMRTRDSCGLDIC